MPCTPAPTHSPVGHPSPPPRHWMAHETAQEIPHARVMPWARTQRRRTSGRNRAVAEGEELVGVQPSHLIPSRKFDAREVGNRRGTYRGGGDKFRFTPHNTTNRPTLHALSGERRLTRNGSYLHVHLAPTLEDRGQHARMRNRRLHPLC